MQQEGRNPGKRLSGGTICIRVYYANRSGTGTFFLSVATISRPTDVLLVEDNPSDVYLTQVAFRRSSAETQIHVVEDGIQAMAFLRQETPYASAPRPDLVLLDLNLPRKHGLKVLREIKEDPGLRKIPVIILTTSTADADIELCYEDHANCYIAKPVDFDQFERVVREIESFWFQCVKLPRHD
jgi:CheY-like chemotaxis protein